MTDFIPKWHRELETFDKIKPIIIIEGNVLDTYQYPVEGSTPKGSIVRLPPYLHYFFKDSGYRNIVFYDSIRGFSNPCEDGYIKAFGEMIKEKPDNAGFIRAPFKTDKGVGPAPAHVRAALTQAAKDAGAPLVPTVVIFDFASRSITSPDNMDQREIDAFTILLQAGMDSRDIRTSEHGVLKNLLVVLVNKVNDLPPWFYLDNPNVKTIRLCPPSKEEREQLVKGANFSTFFAKEIYAADKEYYRDRQEELAKIQDKFVALSEGFSFTELNGLRRLCKNQKLHVKNMCDVISLYKFGIKENPWNTLDYEAMKNAHADFQKRVKRQELALTKTLDVIKRAMTGMAGLQSSSHSKPKGVLFFAGPTGTGKTETAKTLAEKLFGDERNCLRFDMSEFSQAHSDQRLLGAPPGYVGYEAGGQLTNAVKNNPFSILLFDEIEKAHPSILDKFLQILEDGRMTDGQGNTVYFSESIIIFTSNLGIYTLDSRGNRVPNVTADMPYDQVREQVRKGIEDYFKLQLGRPEILNRIGENIVVFDFIRPPVAIQILEAQIGRIRANLQAEKNITLEISDHAREILKQQALGNLDNGGRGIGNIVESHLINPLARYAFDHGIFHGRQIVVEDIDLESPMHGLTCTVK